jgi:hypothetical protein
MGKVSHTGWDQFTETWVADWVARRRTGSVGRCDSGDGGREGEKRGEDRGEHVCGDVGYATLGSTGKRKMREEWIGVHEQRMEARILISSTSRKGSYKRMTGLSSKMERTDWQTRKLRNKNGVGRKETQEAWRKNRNARPTPRCDSISPRSILKQLDHIKAKGDPATPSRP